jgi:hypothetical protein
MTQATKQVFSNGETQSGPSSSKVERSAAEEWCSTPHAIHRMDEEEAEEVVKALAKPQKASPALRSLFAKKW